jgi:transcriptional regulator with XRE-family HTH domain
MTDTSTRAQLVAARIRTARTGRGWTLRDLSERLDHSLSVGQLSKIETSQRGLSIDELAAIANELSITPEYLMRAGDLCPTCHQEINR